MAKGIAELADQILVEDASSSDVKHGMQSFRYPVTSADSSERLPFKSEATSPMPSASQPSLPLSASLLRTPALPFPKSYYGAVYRRFEPSLSEGSPGSQPPRDFALAEHRLGACLLSRVGGRVRGLGGVRTSGQGAGAGEWDLGAGEGEGDVGVGE
jgi:hypothetical protein